MRKDWPSWVTRANGDVENLLPSLGQFDLIYADADADADTDAEGGKWTRLDLTLDALADMAILLVDDMDIKRYGRSDHRTSVAEVHSTLFTDPRLVAVDLPIASGVTLVTRRAKGGSVGA